MDETAYKAPEKNTRRLSPLPHCDSNFTRGYNAANYYGRAFAQSFVLLLMSLSAAAQRFRYSDGSPV